MKTVKTNRRPNVWRHDVTCSRDYRPLMREGPVDGMLEIIFEVSK
jgi:hypothetical protein